MVKLPPHAFMAPLTCGFSLAITIYGCAADDPLEDPPKPNPIEKNVEGEGQACASAPPYVENLTSCTPLETDYQPRVNHSAADAWNPCISDDDAYHRVENNVSSIGRVAAYEQMAALLWANPNTPTPQDFIDARVIFETPEGLGSRVQRRHDIHYAEPPNGAKCSDAGIPDAYPDRCVGPAKLLPIINDSFVKGASGDNPRVQAARIDAALIWFFYVSVLSESISCTTAAKDCDSAWAYYSGGTPRGEPIGFGKRIAAISAATHHRAYDGVLAVRCWRGLDSASTATHTDLRDRALAQADKAMVRGIALLVRQRFAELECATGAFDAASVAFIGVIAPLLNRAAQEQTVPNGVEATSVIAAQAANVTDVAAATSAIDLLFTCP